ncbi:MAG: SIS domain-containing protein [Massilibacteroides sp.]|nr:SIS domain-containing protein [Massilibacteroides sp.]MDD3062980.1 SIS domain-containing protein [Massilibacteroides sp.]MDD4116316.1 SIS domain-containing protein [Massilibacteroides sp.]
MNEIIRDSLAEALDSLQRFMAQESNLVAVESAAKRMAAALAGGHKVMSCGNGGSLCDASHFAEELTGRYRSNRLPLPAVAINDAAHITCVGNDYSFAEIYSRYVEAVGDRGDVLLAISTSGNSENILNACEAAKQKGMWVVGLTCDSDNLLRRLSDVAICAPKTNYSDRIQEIHIKVIHILIQLIEHELAIN